MAGESARAAGGPEIGLRIDVDTFRGTRDGVPALLDSLAEAGVRASFFFSVGPDNMGRHLWRLLRPAFLLKMLRSNAASLYGWDILLRGTLWPGPPIAARLGDVIRRTADEGHEVGLHAWDHHAWQAHLERMDSVDIRANLERGVAALETILGRAPSCSAVAGWICDERVLLEKERLGFEYNSDCRGESIFRPVVGSETLAPQVPVTLPTYDEVIGRDGVTDENYNERLLARIGAGERGEGLEVLTIHAEVEGDARHELWLDFLRRLQERGRRLVPLGELVRAERARGAELPRARIGRGGLEGREGWLCVQGATLDA